MDQQSRIAVLFLMTVAVLATPASAISPNANTTTCQASTVGGNAAFKVCLFRETNNLVTDLLADAAHLIVSTYNSQAWAIGQCYCRQNCSPSQLVCQDPAGFKSALNTLLPNATANIDVFNAWPQIAYAGEMWNFYCYCPSLIPAGTDPCATTNTPSTCPLNGNCPSA